jgi:hypothetical protein
MDLDGDGILSLYEIEYFYEEQLQRMEQLGIETLPFEDCLCQVIIATSTELKGMTFDHDFGYSFPLFSSFLKKRGKRKGE